MSQQPEAIKHAEWLKRSLTIGAPEAAAELRRLHAVELEAIALRAQVERLQAGGGAPYAYACPANCGCLWRDNKDGTMSLFGENSKSCKVCEPLPLSALLPVYQQPGADPEWDGLCEAMRWLNEVELAQGGANGPTIKLRAALTALAAHPPAPVAAAPALVPLTAAQMEKGRDQIFSINNPYCPCDSKTFRKVAQWVEAHHGINGLTVGGGGAKS